jgi:hypothetical protein
MLRLIFPGTSQKGGQTEAALNTLAIPARELPPGEDRKGIRSPCAYNAAQLGYGCWRVMGVFARYCEG